MGEYYQKNKDRIKIKTRKYFNTPYGRAVRLVCNYNHGDEKYGREKGDLTAKWVFENILFKPCAHCGATGWNIIGCNRLDNSKPHTMDNVEPCCWKCNAKLNGIDLGEKRSKKVFQYTLDGELIAVYSSATEAGNNICKNPRGITRVCRGEREKAYGYKWSYEPL